MYGRHNSPQTSTPNHYALNEIFAQPITASHLFVSTRHRAWIILTRSEHLALIQHRVHENAELFSLLEDLGIILTERNIRDTTTIHTHRYGLLHRPPSLFLMVPTNRCNMACAYCHAEAGDAGDHSLDMSEETARRTVDFFLTIPSVAEKKILRIEFQGGECLLRWDLIRSTMDYANARCQELGYSSEYTFATNLLGMTDEIAREIRERKNVRLSSSLDGPEAINDRQRVTQNGKGTYALHRSWAERLRDEYSIPAGFLPTLTRNNLGHVRGLIDEYLQRGAKTIYLRYVNQVGRAYTDSYDTLGLSPEEYLQLWQEGLDYILQVNRTGGRFSERKTAELLGNLIDPTYAYMCLRRPCGMAIHQVVVDQQGDIYGCDQARSNPMYRLGNVYTDTYDDCYLSETAQLMRTMVAELTPVCQTCAFSPYCGYCVARGTRQHGTPLQKVPEDFECQIYARMIPTLLRYLMDDQHAAILNAWV